MRKIQDIEMVNDDVGFLRYLRFDLICYLVGFGREAAVHLRLFMVGVSLNLKDKFVLADCNKAAHGINPTSRNRTFALSKLNKVSM